MGVGAEIGRGGWRDGMLSLQNKKNQMGMLEELTQFGTIPIIFGQTPSERQPQKEKREVGTSYLKDYFVKHRELIMGFTVIVLLDHFIFEGAFRERIKKIVHSFLDKAESKLAAVEQK